VNGSLKNILPEDPAVIKTLKTLGILNAKGNEIFYNCVVFPIYDTDGAIVNLYGRNIDPAHGVSHLYLAGSRSGLVNRQAVPRSASIILTESIIDAVTLYDQGFTNVIPAYGVNGVTEDHLVLFNGAVTEVYLCFDSDQAGKDGAAQAAAQLQKKGITVYTVELPDKDITIYFNRHTPEEFEQLLKDGQPGIGGAVRFAEQAQTNPIPAGRTRLHGGLRHTAVPGEGHPAGRYPAESHHQGQ
jgi:DNA primase